MSGGCGTERRELGAWLKYTSTPVAAVESHLATPARDVSCRASFPGRVLILAIHSSPTVDCRAQTTCLFLCSEDQMKHCTRVPWMHRHFRPVGPACHPHFQTQGARTLNLFASYITMTSTKLLLHVSKIIPAESNTCYYRARPVGFLFLVLNISQFMSALIFAIKQSSCLDS